MIAILGKPDPETKDEEEDELKEKEHVSMDQLNEWEKNFINMPVSEMFPLLIAGKEFCETHSFLKPWLFKGQLFSELIDEFIISPKLQTKNC